jgi:muramidase (phage lysozyme)
MAENLDPEIVMQFQEAMKEATDAAKAMPAAMNAMIDAINKASNPIKNNTKEINDNTDAIEDNTDATEERTKKDEAAAKAIEERNKAELSQKVALQEAKNALKSFADALLSGERGFGKFGKAMENAGDSALDFGKSLGPFGTILGRIVKGATMAASAMAKQADDSLKATDQLSKMGSAGAFSANEVRKLGTGLGLASDQLDKFVKPVSTLGSSLINLGGNAADGVVEFQKLAKELQGSRQEYQRLGISQEELIQTTADYVNLQTMQGRQITDQMKRDGFLRVAAREYTDNLLELSALTGKDIDAVKKKNELAMSEIETAIQNNLLDQEINRLRKLGTNESKAQANQLEQERKARDRLLQRVENEVGDPALRKGLAKFLATGAITEEVAALKRIGVPIEDFAAKIKQGVDVSDQFMDSLSRNADATMKNIGTAAMFDENTRKAFGVSSEMMQYLARARDRDEKAQSDLIRERIRKTKEGEGPAGADPAQIARNKLTEAEIAAKVALDDLVASANPLMTNFNEMSLTVKALIVAAGIATVALSGLAIAAGKQRLDTAIGKARAASPKADKVLDTGSKAAKAAKFGGGAVAVGAGVVSGVSAYRAGDTEGVGGAVGGTAGALVGGALGSVLGPVGTILGGMAGQYFGEMAGRWITRDEDKKDPKVGAAINRADLEQEKAAIAREKYAQEQRANDTELGEAEQKLAKRKLLQVQKEEAILLNKEAHLDFENAKDELEKQAAREKSDRARKVIAQSKIDEILLKLEDEKNEEKRKALLQDLNKAKEQLAEVDMLRARQVLNSQADEEEKKAAQLRIDNAKKELESEEAMMRVAEEMRKAELELKKATNEQEKKNAEENIKALKEGLEKELEAINKKYNVVEAIPAGQSSGSERQSTPVIGLGNLDVRDVPTYAGEYADGGLIPGGKFGLVGERGPEFISGPAQITNIEQMMQGIAFKPLSEESQNLQDTFYHTDLNVKELNKELNHFVKEDPAKKLAEQLELVTDALEDFQIMIDPNLGSAGAAGSAAGGGGGAKGIVGSIMTALGMGRSRTRGRAATSSSQSGGVSDTESSDSQSTGSSDGIVSTGGGNFGITPGPDGKILDFIGKLESRGNYNILVGGKTQTDPPLTDMTVGQVLEFQRGMLKRGHESTAVGKYQIIRKTLEGLIQRGVVSLNDKFDQSTQDKAALGLLDVRKRQDFLTKKIDAETYANNLAKEWASLPMPDGRSFYAGVGSNKAHASRQEFMTAIQAKTGGLTQGPESGYLATLHGNEIIVPLDPSSILADLGKKSSTQVASEMVQKTQNITNMNEDTTLKEIVSANKFMAELLSNKLDNMITQLEISNDTQEKLLKYSQV